MQNRQLDWSLKRNNIMHLFAARQGRPLALKGPHVKAQGAALGKKTTCIAKL
jgi:hypothetical protein